ncbi:hypothetical protein [Geoalkalibacter halelectricus]|uniref:hypothetical protein n=1 Tax=Geoalkalibacter halelectricus TaxID=2847045 RepID=UPI003D1B615E
MTPQYPHIRRTPAFIAAYKELRAYLKDSSPLAFSALPAAMKTILDVIDRHPRSWPLKRKSLGAKELEFHLAIVGIAYRRLHVRYFVDSDNISYLAAVWVDGQDEPRYIVPPNSH